MLRIGVDDAFWYKVKKCGTTYWYQKKLVAKECVSSFIHQFVEKMKTSNELKVLKRELINFHGDASLYRKKWPNLTQLMINISNKLKAT